MTAVILNAAYLLGVVELLKVSIPFDSALLLSSNASIKLVTVAPLYSFRSIAIVVTLARVALLNLMYASPGSLAVFVSVENLYTRS